MVNKNSDHQTRELLPSDLLEEEQLLFLVSCCEVTACHSVPDSHTFLEQLCVGSLPLEQKRNMQADQHLSLAVISYLEFLLALCVSVYFNLF